MSLDIVNGLILWIYLYLARGSTVPVGGSFGEGGNVTYISIASENIRRHLLSK